MKTITTSILILLISLQFILPIYAVDEVETTGQSVPTESKREIPIVTDTRQIRQADPSIPTSVTPVYTTSQNGLVYPDGEPFQSLKRIIDTKFTLDIFSNNHSNSCLFDGKLCTNYRYTSIDENAIKLIILKTFVANESFYEKIFYNNGDDSLNSYRDIKIILGRVPVGAGFSDWKVPNFGDSIAGDLLDTSFGLNFSENTSAGMLGAIDQKIKDMKRTNCQNANQESYSYTLCPWNGELSNVYLPTAEELNSSTIYWNGKSVPVARLKDEFAYQIFGATRNSTRTLAENYPTRNELDRLESSLMEEKKNAFSNAGSGEIVDMRYLTYLETMKRIRQNPSVGSSQNALKDMDTAELRSNLSQSEKDVIAGIKSELRYYIDTLTTIGANITYTLKYTKDSYTLEEAKADLEKKDAIISSGIFITSGGRNGQLPCSDATNYLIRSECLAAVSNGMLISTALGAYFSDKEKYPDSIDALDRNYLPRQDDLPKFKENFEYSNTSSGGVPDFQIKYIGHIGEGSTASGTDTSKRDYIALMSGATVPTIPSIFSHIPADSMVLYVKDPENLINLLNQKSNTSNRLSGIDVSESIRDFMKAFFELQNFDQIEKHLTHEMAVVVNNLDATAPDIVIILSEADREALSPTAKARVVGSKDGYIYIASSKDSLDRVMNISLEKSLAKAPDFWYVWWKKSSQIHDALIFVGDAFFEKMLTFETYITHYRKYRDYKRLSALQALVWSYSDAFGKPPTTLSDLENLGLSTLTGSALQDYSVQDGLVVEKHIGSLQSLKTLPESGYDLSRITRGELEDYKMNVLKYRDIWRASLDPMGIVLNRYGDGMEIDFFMTPIPTLENGELSQMQKLFQGVTKDSLAFMTNPHIRMGLASFVYGFDPKKLQAKITADKELASQFKSINQEIMGGTDILDYLGGEFAFSLGGLDADIFDGWNVDKVDAYFSVQVATEEKGKELIDLLRKKIAEQFGSSEEMKTVVTFLAKPLIEDYAGKKIYYSEKIPLPFIGGLSFAYTFVDDFFIIGLNKNTIKHVIDVAVSGDDVKKRILDTNSLSSGTFLTLLFDGEGMSHSLKGLYDKNLPSLPRYMKNLNMNGEGIMTLMRSYVISAEYDRRLGKVSMLFDHTLGALQVRGSNGELTLTLDEKKMNVLSGSSLDLWNTLKKNPSFPKDLLTSSGTTPDVLFANDSFADILSLNLIVQLDSAFRGSQSLLRNVVFGMNMGNDEIGFDLKIFRDKNISPKSSASGALLVSGNSMTLIFSIICSILILGGCTVGFVILRRRQNTNISNNIPLILPIESIPIVSIGGSLQGATSVPVVTPENPTVSPIVIPTVNNSSIGENPVSLSVPLVSGMEEVVSTSQPISNLSPIPSITPIPLPELPK